MRQLTAIITAALCVATFSLAACGGGGSGAVTVDSAQARALTAHFETGSALPVRVSSQTGDFTSLTRIEANKLHFMEQRYRLTCGLVTVLTDDLNAGQATCKALQPNSDIIISAA